MHDTVASAWTSHAAMRMALLQEQLKRTLAKLDEGDGPVDDACSAAGSRPGPTQAVLLKRAEALQAKLDALKEEDAAHPLPVATASVDDLQLRVFRCDGCRCDIIEPTARFHATCVSDYDLCAACAAVTPLTAHLPVAGLDLPAYIEVTLSRISVQAIIRTATADEAQRSVPAILALAFAGYGPRPCLMAHRDPLYLPPGSVLTYAEVYAAALNFAAALEERLAPRATAQLRIGICGANSIPWFIADLGCLLRAHTVFPIHTDARDAVLAALLGSIAFDALVVDDARLPRLAAVITSLDASPVLLPMSAVYHPGHGKSDVRLMPRQVAAGELESSLVTVVHTSGSTGVPKGAPFSQTLWARLLLDSMHARHDPFVVLSKDPLAHISDREAVHCALVSGGRVGVISSKETLFENILAYGPSTISATPRFWNAIFSDFHRELFARLDAAGLPRISIDAAWSHSRSEWRYAPPATEAAVAELRSSAVAALPLDDMPPAEAEAWRIALEMIEAYGSLLGPRLTSIGCGGAKSDNAVLGFLRAVFGPIVSDGYGSTELGNIANDAGIVYSHIMYKLRPLPELGYTLDDVPYPRGEFLAKSRDPRFMITSYYGDAGMVHADAWDADGYFHTGDIVELRGSRKIRIIDRIKSVFKLTSGVLVAAAALEATYLSALPAVLRQVFITSGSFGTQQDSVAAVIVPHFPLRLPDGSELTSAADFRAADASVQAAACDALIAALAGAAAMDNSNISPQEIPFAVVIETEPFSVANGLLTSSHKPARVALQAAYQGAIDAACSRASLGAMVADVLGLSGVALTDSFVGAGGDSLTGLRLASKLKAAGIELPAEDLGFLAGDMSLQEVADSLASGGAPSVSNGAAHTATAVLADVATPFATLDCEPGPSRDNRDGVLVTGATGHVGRAVIDALIATGSQVRVFAIVRESSAATEALPAGVEMVMGDLTLAGLGVDVDVMTRAGIRAVIHAGAWVSHVHPYAALAEANVHGTRRVLEMARAIGASYVVHVSTASASAVPADGPRGDEGGYALSKWAAERVCVAARAELRLTIPIVRLGMVGPDYASGRGNARDWFSALVDGMEDQGAVPVSDASIRLVDAKVVGRVLAGLAWAQTPLTAVAASGGPDPLEVEGRQQVAFARMYA
ncbi:ATP/NADPH-dependent carboxylic acid reductase [Thecamonas trahens ATCC 50062]|uniref:ATP/NADPH-dependent carboxylic acid reductase n=1 Tax=Thecamonas trahens ATCC 50062 TaxID=461836 RepID=A0A0L0DJU2_THETB|nr:ATP/NADPH-dependent carboxylic acid reductase [Thecamonas trahens ATCC 50062]KNC52485.1 ATP/NADPH-dependent carboxylic acid reductase [Thecamonas trahens ATCC 50062]|eukprot:XP_013755282.1 ATP/NADPH-dependent carboxylic acid reductase [Thecamonas trahens ATCC 50062]